jgi:hypothetical protein
VGLVANRRHPQPAWQYLIAFSFQKKETHRHFASSFSSSFVEMSDETSKGSKRARTQDQQDGAGAGSDLPGRDQLLLTSPEMQTRLGRKFVEETELLPLLLAHGLVRRVRTICIEVRPLGGDSLKVTLDASKPTVGEAKAEIARSQGTAEGRQELYKVAERADGLAVREDDAEPELLDDQHIELEDGNVVALAVKVRCFLNKVYNKPSSTVGR